MVHIEEIKTARTIIVTNDETGESESYPIHYNFKIRVREGEYIKKGTRMTEGNVFPGDILNILGVQAVQDYIISEVQKVYRLQGVDINDKHIEVIVRQMLRKVKVDDSGSSYLLPGTMVDRRKIMEVNDALQERIDNGETEVSLVTVEPMLQGITKASSSSDSFLSAASFQETTKALTDAAIRGKSDYLYGLKENVIIGKLIPAGTGMKCYSNIHLNTDSMIEEEEDEDLILTEDLEDDAPAAPMAEAPVEESSAEEEKPMLDFDFEEMIPSKDDTEE